MVEEMTVGVPSDTNLAVGKPQKADRVAALNGLFAGKIEALKSGDLDPDELLTNGTLAFSRLVDEVPAHFRMSYNGVTGDPSLYSPFRELKFLAEGVHLSHDEVEKQHADLIHEIRKKLAANPSRSSRSDFARANGKLYARVCADPHSSTIFRLGGVVNGRPDYIYWTDEQLVAEAAEKANSFTNLKMGAGTSNLHRHICARGLKAEVVRLNPSYSNHFYVGLGEYMYRSEPELVAGNLFFIAGLNVQREYNTGIYAGSSNKPLIGDFHFPDIPLLLEISQNDSGDRGSRRAGYKARNDRKLALYSEQLTMPFRFVNSDHFYERGVFDAIGFANAVVECLMDFGLVFGELPDPSLLLYRSDSLKERLFTESTETIVPFLNSLGIDGIATLQNKFSHVLTHLQYRSDFDEVMGAIKRQGEKARVEKSQATKKARRLKSREGSQPGLFDGIAQWGACFLTNSMRYWKDIRS